jgi:hypothetical protein
VAAEARASAAAAEVTVAEAVERPAAGCSDDFCAALTFSAGNGWPSRSVPCLAATCRMRLVLSRVLVLHWVHWNRVGGGTSTGTSGGKEAGGRLAGAFRFVCFVRAISVDEESVVAMLIRLMWMSQ